MKTPLKSSLFAVAPNWIAAVLADAKVTYAAQTPAGAAFVPVVGLLGQGIFAHTSYPEIRTALWRAGDNPEVRAIKLFISSPGGECAGLPETAAVIRAVARKKPVDAYVSDLAASAAYWLAAQCSTITASPSAELGSVGILDAHMDLSGALEQAGIKPTVITAGQFKGERLPFQPLSDAARSHMQSSVDEWYQQFLTEIRQGRGHRVDPSSAYGDGRLLTAKQALAAGLIDFVGTL